MYVSANKQLMILKPASLFCLDCTRERVKRRFLVSKIFAGNIRICRRHMLTATSVLSRSGIECNVKGYDERDGRVLSKITYK